ncbi:MAG TPA: hypothetical protein VJH24_00405 [Candidatus Bilamarchaeaceae archaeon]|nr:hypothetical protein [Candidatus Bilamarchaeaceae archaeon]
MTAIEEGKVCVVTAGRRAGQKVEITKLLPHGFVQARFLEPQGKGKTSKDGKTVSPAKQERKYSLRHLEPLEGKK